MDAPEQPILLAGRYAYVRELGRGGAGRLILAADVASGARRAIKVVPEQEAERLRWERAHLDRVAHPALAEVYELLTLGERLRAPWGLERGAAALVEEHVEGVSAWRRASEIPAEARVAFTVTIAARVARALGAIHSASLVHGDVKPANIVVGDDPGQAKLVDLGLAQPAGLAVAIGGTAGYLAPEVLLGERLPAGDLYALGATMHALLTRRSADDSQASATDPERGWTRRPELRELGPEVPIALRRLIGDLIAERASDRPASAGEVALRLDAIASELGIALADDVAVSTAPSPIERATRARAVRFTGREAALSQLVAALREPGVVAVLGPEGAGRTRAIREAVRALQAERGWSATYVHDTGARPPRLTHDAIVHLAAEPIDWDACARAVDAASLAGTALTVVAPAGRGPEGVRSVELGPLPQDGVRSLLAELLQVDPSPALVDAACEASGALPGRLCRLVATALEEGREPARPATLRELGGRAGADAWEVRDLPLAALTSVAGGSLRAEDARGIVEEAAAEAHRLLASGWATVTESGRLTLREDLVRSVYAGLDASARAGWARALDGVELDAAARACVDAALGRVDRAVQSMLSAMRGARTRGEPERAAMLAQRLTDRIGSVPIELARAHADALRALAREEEALDVLAAADDEASRTDRAELLRLLGRSDDATAALDGCESAAASRVRARIALGRGDASSALESIAHVESTDDEEAARLAEIRALAALAAGRFDDARAAAQEGLRAAARCDDPAIEARASSVDGSVLYATGRTGEAASRYERAFELAERAGERYAAASYLVNVGLGRFERGDAGGAIEALREGARRLTDLGRPALAARVLYNLGNVAVLVGDDDLGRSATQRAQVQAERDPQVRAYASVVGAELALRAGKHETAANALEEAFATEGVPDAAKVVVGARLAMVRAARGERARSGEVLEAIDALEPDGFGEVMREIARARVALAGDAPDAAAEAARTALLRAEGAGWECRLRAALVATEAFERAGESELARGAAMSARTLLDAASESLRPDARRRLRGVADYQRALAVAPQAEPQRASADPRYRALAAQAKALVREPGLRRLKERLVDAAVELSGAQRGFLVSRRSDGEIDVSMARAFGADLRGERPSRSVCARVLDSARPLVALDALEDERLDAAASVHALTLRSVIAVPVPLRGERPYALVLDDRLRPAAFDDATLSLLGDLAELAAGAIERARALREERRLARRLAREARRLSERALDAELQVSSLRAHAAGSPFGRIVGESEPMRAALHLAERVAAADAPVLVLGESGTGKELIARAIHDASPRRDGPYVSENCSAIPESLLESTLFGHVRGAFTGADRARRGLFEVADQGTLFLDEIGEMSPVMQSKLLRVLQDGELRPIGSERTRKVDVRLVSATHRDLAEMARKKTFREDLFYRVAVVQVQLPPLRERPDDVAPLCRELLARYDDGRARTIEPSALRAMRAYAWPGNVRELENELRRALLMTDGAIGLAHLSPALRGGSDGDDASELDLRSQTDALERRLIRGALARCQGNQTRAAKALGVSRYGLQKMIKRLSIDLAATLDPS